MLSTIWTEVAALAFRQHGVISRAQLLGLGMTPRVIQRAIESGRLHVLHRGVYAVGHRDLPRWGWQMAAVLALGLAAVVSHRSAAWMLSLWHSSRSVVEVTVPSRAGRRRREGLVVHRIPLHRDDVIEVEGVPCTSVARTVLDLAAVTRNPWIVERVLVEAEATDRFDPVAFEALIERSGSRPGCRELRRALGRFEPADGRFYRSGVERRVFNALKPELAARGLPLPDVNLGIALDGDWISPDLSWRDMGLAVELDVHPSHRTAAGVAEDERRDRALTAAGWRVLRFGERELGEELATSISTIVGVMRAFGSGRG